jgi:hypothetical protein
MFSGVRCAVCGMALESPGYLKIFDPWGTAESLYWFNPKISDLTDQVVNFCSPEHSLEWYQKAIAAKTVVAHDNDPEQSQPTPEK